MFCTIKGTLRSWRDSRSRLPYQNKSTRERNPANYAGYIKGGEIRDAKTLTRNMSKFVARQVVSLMKNEQQSQTLLLKVDPCSSFRNNIFSTRNKCFCCPTS